MFRDKVVLTGGSGYLGRGILRRATRENWPAQMIVYSRDELKQSLCRARYPDAHYILGDVRDLGSLQRLFVGVETVIHTAALKYVPEGEWNVSECLSVNVGGTQTVIDAARWAGVKNVVVVSTDKAVEPTNVYGMTKALGERLVGESCQYGGTKVTGVRYGNVVGSTGSVVPAFVRQAEETGQVQVTDATMTRFWLGVDQAVDLIIAALSPDVRPGSILIPNPKSMELGALVQALVPRATVKETGLRPGEKMHETLLTETESRFAHHVPSKIMDATYELLAVSLRSGLPRSSFTFDISSLNAPRLESEEFLALVEDSREI